MHSLFRVTVQTTESLAPHLQRLTLHAPEFADFQLTGPDEFFGLVMPQLGENFAPFDTAGTNIRAAVTAIPEPQRPGLRWYTIRGHQPERATVTMDAVTHGDNGPGSAWIRRAQPGQEAGFFRCQALWVPPQTHDGTQHGRPGARQLLVADASALPALRHILECHAAGRPTNLGQADPPDLARTDVIAVVSSEDEVEPGLIQEWEAQVGGLRVVTAPAEVGRAMDELYAEGPELLGSVWASGEGDMTKAVRYHAMQRYDLDSDAIFWCPYWFVGKARP